jgi:hypothetical protein
MSKPNDIYGVQEIVERLRREGLVPFLDGEGRGIFDDAERWLAGADPRAWGYVDRSGEDPIESFGHGLACTLDDAYNRALADAWVS